MPPRVAGVWSAAFNARPFLALGAFGFGALMDASHESLKNDLIDYLLIKTHHRELNDALRRLLSPKFDLVLDIYPKAVAKLDGFAPVRCHDGVQIYKRKNI